MKTQRRRAFLSGRSESKSNRRIQRVLRSDEAHVDTESLIRLKMLSFTTETQMKHKITSVTNYSAFCVSKPMLNKPPPENRRYSTYPGPRPVTMTSSRPANDGRRRRKAVFPSVADCISRDVCTVHVTHRLFYMEASF